ncbi:MAG: hypothetical protein GY898_30400 [Proteobacteria bacterium]|nr:hypothetical protein [Pseudomonadota bacterium]
MTSLTDTLDADGLDRLVVTVETGDLVVEGDPDATEVTVEVDLVTTRTSEGKDEDAMTATRLELVSRDDGSAVLTVRFDPKIARYETLVLVMVPDTFAVTASRSSSDDGQITSIEGVDAIGVNDGDGELDVTNITGGGAIDDAGGDLTADGFGADLSVIDRDGDATISDVDGDLSVDDGDGDLFISDVTGSVTIIDGAGDINVSNVGSLDVESDSSGSVSVN